MVKVVYPLKQGLKQWSKLNDTGISFQVKVVYPLKQGLKLPAPALFNFFPYFIVKVVYPLKQGLKPESKA